MGDQRKAQDLVSKSLDRIEFGPSDRIVEQEDTGGANSSSVTLGIATVPLELAPEIHNNGEKAPRATSTFKYGKSVSKVLPKINGPAKNAMTPRRFFIFVFGLFLAGIAGSFSNGFITTALETVYAPQYVKDFHDAEGLLERDQDQAFAGMHKALIEGESIEPQSHRFTDLAASCARQLGDADHYLEAKSQWARAASPSDIASPELRELKRSYLINEAKSEHLALVSQMKEDVDLDLLNDVEKAAKIFQMSGVTAHTWRAFQAYVMAGSLAADANDFKRARRDFNSAQELGNGHWIGNMSVIESLLEARWPAQINDHRMGNISAIEYLFEARWLAQLQENVRGLLALKETPVLRSQYNPAGWRSTYETTHFDLKSKQFDHLQTTLDDAQKAHLQDVFGYTIVTDIYAIGHSWSTDDTGELQRQLLREWSIERPRSARPRLAMAFSLTAQAAQIVDALRGSWPSEESKTQAYLLLYRAAQNLQQAQILEPHVAYEPSFIEAIQRNLYIAENLSNCSYPSNKLASDLRLASITMTGDDSQLFLSELTHDADRVTQTMDSRELILKRALDLADKIGGQAGDEFYTRAIWRLGALITAENIDTARYKKGESYLRTKFGVFQDAIP